MSQTTPDLQLLDMAAGLEPPWMLLEDGRGTGTTILAWDAEERLTIPWGEVRDFHPGDGWFGAIAYDVGLPPHARRHEPMIEQPMVELFRPRRKIVLKGGEGRGGPGREGEVNEANGIPSRQVPSPPVHDRPRLSPPVLSWTQPEFETAVAKSLGYIGAGDIYQVNLSVAQKLRITGKPLDIYRRLRAINPSPWMGMADFGDWQLLSGSPELLVEVKDGRARARPIAGTRKKTGERAHDEAMRRELLGDAKESAEHVMLVDLARNDLGRVAAFGSVEVSDLAQVAEYSHVMHLESDVVATLAAGLRPLDAFTALFPGGTITGCPKIRAMEIIAELEPVARGMYTGAMGWWSGDAGQWNILIRSAVVRGGEAVIQSGAGIVADSDPAREWKESLRKAAALREAFGA